MTPSSYLNNGVHPENTFTLSYQAGQVANSLLPGIALYETRKAQSGRLEARTRADYLPHVLSCLGAYQKGSGPPSTPVKVISGGSPPRCHPN